MRLRTLVTWIVVLLTGGNLLFSLTEPANVIYLPVWGTLSIGPPAALYLLVVAVVAVAGVRWYGPRTVRWRAAAAGVCLACLTFIQAMIGRGRFGVVEISPDAVLCNYTDFPASSALARTITADVRRAMSE